MTSRAADVLLTPPPATILVVDDSPMNLQVLVRTLHGSGHRILAARDGRSALDIVKRARPDLVLLDVMMPEIDGFEVCRSIKADPDGQDTIVIFSRRSATCRTRCRGCSSAPWTTSPSRFRPRRCSRASPPTSRGSTSSASCAAAAIASTASSRAPAGCSA
jgi:CheY-like chemotaxis protein